MPNAKYKDKLTLQQSRFVSEYLSNGMNATKAAIAAGYSEKTAESQGSRLLSNVKVSAAISGKAVKVMAKLEEKMDFSVERTMEYVARLAFFDPKELFEDDGSLKMIGDIPEHTRSVIAGLEVSEIFDGSQGEQKHAIGLMKKVKLSDRRGALDMLMRYHSLYKDKMEVTLDAGLAEALSRARKRSRR